MISILFVEDDPGFHELARDYLEEGGEISVTTAQSATEAIRELKEGHFDAIVSDYMMPDMTGIDFLKHVRKHHGDIPFIVFTGKGSEEVVIEAINNGADFYIQKTGAPAVRFTEMETDIRHAVQHRRAENALHELNRELEAFCYSVSHDLRAPMRIIGGYLAILQEKYHASFPPDVQQYMERIVAANQRMEEMIGHLLRLSRVGRADLHVETVSLTTLSREVLDDMIRQEPERAIDVFVEEDLIATCDRDLVAIALGNLLHNAWKYTSRVERAQIRVGSIQKGNRRFFYVRDNGAGFNSTQAVDLFMPFRRFHPESEFPGTGIGLATVYRVIRRHGGEIWADSNPGSGATFYFSLPTRAPPKGNTNT